MLSPTVQTEVEGWGWPSDEGADKIAGTLAFCAHANGSFWTCFLESLVRPRAGRRGKKW